MPAPHDPPLAAYDLHLGDAVPDGAGATALPGGWAGPEGPAIDPADWPRSPRTGQPLRHCLTLWLPEPYRRRPGTVAVSIFQWHDAFGSGPALPHLSSATAARQVGEAFAAALAAARPHPRSRVVVHPDTEAIYAIVDLDPAELAGARQPRPVGAPPFPEEEFADHVEPGAPMGAVWLVPRDDPNAGLAPAAARYREVSDRYRVFASEHLGGTLTNPDDAGAGRLSPWYLELEGAGGFDFAGGDLLAFDLAADDPLAWTRPPG